MTERETVSNQICFDARNFCIEDKTPKPAYVHRSNGMISSNIDALATKDKLPKLDVYGTLSQTLEAECQTISSTMAVVNKTESELSPLVLYVLERAAAPP